MGSEVSVRLSGLMGAERENHDGQRGRLRRQEKRKTEIDRRIINWLLII